MSFLHLFVKYLPFKFFFLKWRLAQRKIVKFLCGPVRKRNAFARTHFRDYYALKVRRISIAMQLLPLNCLFQYVDAWLLNSSYTNFLFLDDITIWSYFSGVPLNLTRLINCLFLTIWKYIIIFFAYRQYFHLISWHMFKEYIKEINDQPPRVLNIKYKATFFKSIIFIGQPFVLCIEWRKMTEDVLRIDPKQIYELQLGAGYSLSS